MNVKYAASSRILGVFRVRVCYFGPNAGGNQNFGTDSESAYAARRARFQVFSIPASIWARELQKMSVGDPQNQENACVARHEVLSEGHIF